MEENNWLAFIIVIVALILGVWKIYAIYSADIPLWLKLVLILSGALLKRISRMWSCQRIMITCP